MIAVHIRAALALGWLPLSLSTGSRWQSSWSLQDASFFQEKMPAGVGQVAMWHMFEFIHWPYSSFFHHGMVIPFIFFLGKFVFLTQKSKKHEHDVETLVESLQSNFQSGWKFACNFACKLSRVDCKFACKLSMEGWKFASKLSRVYWKFQIKLSYLIYFFNCNKYKDWKFDCKLSRNPCKLACKLAIHPWKFTCKVSIYPWKFTCTVSIYPWKFTCKVSGKLSIRLKVWLQTFNQSFKVSCMNLKIYGKKFMNFEWLNHKLIILANEYNSKTTFRISYSSF